MSKSTTIDGARHEDAGAIGRLMSALGYPETDEFYRGRIEELGRSPLDRVLVARRDGSVVGLVAVHVVPSFHCKEPRGRITALVVDRAHWGQGVGKALVEAGLAFGETHGCFRMEVTSGNHRAEAHAFYRSLGFAPPRQRLFAYYGKDT